VYCAWERRQALRDAESRPHLAGLALVVLSVLVFVAGVLAAELFLTRISLVGLIAGTVLFVWGSRHMRILAFPLLLLPLMVPLPAVIFNQIAFPLQLLASRLGEAAVAAAGIPVLREGNVLELPSMTLAVVEACSGIRSLVSLITLATVLAYFTERTLGARVLLVLSAVPIAILANAFRVAGTGYASLWFGPRAAEGFFHTFSGWLIFIVALAGLLAVQQLVRRVPRATARKRSLPAKPSNLEAEEQCSAAP
jgi:exosortase